MLQVSKSLQNHFDAVGISLRRVSASEYDPRYSRFELWALDFKPRRIVGPVINIDEEPSKGWGQEKGLEENAAWICWFAAQPWVRQSGRFEEAEEIGREYLRVHDQNMFGPTPPLFEEPRRPYRCGTILFGAPPEEEAAWNKCWDLQDRRWLAWSLLQPGGTEPEEEESSLSHFDRVLLQQSGVDADVRQRARRLGREGLKSIGYISEPAKYKKSEFNGVLVADKKTKEAILEIQRKHLDEEIEARGRPLSMFERVTKVIPKKSPRPWIVVDYERLHCGRAVQDLVVET